MSDFYIGYLPKMPRSIARVLRPFVGLLLVAGGFFAVIFVFGQQPFAVSVFEFGSVREFTGTIQAEPIPFLIIESEDRSNGLPGFERIPLVGSGKFGADVTVRGFNDKRVKLSGTLIYRDEHKMIEIAGDSVEAIAGGPEIKPDRTSDLGRMVLNGEIIDSKCYLGVMNPGNHKTHRDCAVACLRGGVPAMFLVKDNEGNSSELWLLSSNGEPTGNEIFDFVAEPVEIPGNVYRKGDHLFFHADLKAIRRLP